MTIHTLNVAQVETLKAPQEEYINSPLIDYGLETDTILKELSEQITREIIVDSFDGKRAPNDKKQARLAACVDTVVGNLYVIYVAGKRPVITKKPKAWISVDCKRESYTAKKIPDRYRGEHISYDYLVKKTLEVLLKHGYIEKIPGYKPKNPDEQGYRTRIRPSQKLKDRFEEIYHKAKVDEGLAVLVKRSKTAEVVRMKDKLKKLIDYQETPLTEAMRSNLRRYNEFIQYKTVITHNGERQTVDLSLYRVFNNGDFGLGGRFYGGFWQWLSSEEREKLLIDGEPVVELDYSSLHLSVLYNFKLGIAVPKGDLYDLSAHGIGKKGDPIARKISKKASIIACNTLSVPQAKAALQDYINELIEEGHDVPWDADAVIGAFMRKHEALKEFFCQSHGLGIQRLDSDVVDKILEISVEEQMPVLPIHDSFIVKRSDKDRLLELMISEYQEVMGFTPVVHAA